MNSILADTEVGSIEVFDGTNTITAVGIAQLAQILQDQVLQTAIAATPGTQPSIALALQRGAPYIAAMLAAWRIGAYVIPLNAAWPHEKNRAILEKTRPSLVVLDAKTQSLGAGFAHLDIDAALQSARALPQPTDSALAPLRPSDIAYVIFTSGSTGEPKGVVITAGAYRAYIDWTRRSFSAYRDCRSLLITAELTFDITTGDIAFALAFGTRVGVARDNTNIPAILALIMRHRVDVLYSVPTTHLALTNFAGQKKGADLSSLRLVLSGGDVFPWDLVSTYARLAPGSHFYNVYGPTEVTINCFAVRLDEWVEQIGPGAPVPIGTAFDIIDYRLIDENGGEAKPGTLGELCVTGPQVMAGYFQDADLTRAAFVRDPRFAFIERQLYRTGDLAYVADNGFVYLRGRKDSLVKVRGYRIHPDEAARAIETIPGVQTCAVVAAGDLTDARLAAFVKLTAGSTLTEADIRTALREKVPVYLIPASVALVSHFPLNQSGKIDKRALQKSLAEVVT